MKVKVEDIMNTQKLKERWTSGVAYAGTWHNQHNSEIELKVSSDGLISGIFRTGGAGKHTEVFPLTGFVLQDVIAFSVNFAEHGSVTSWVGHIEQHARGEDAETIETLWHMAVAVGNNEKLAWKSIVSGADRFHRGKARAEDETTSNVALNTVQTSHPLWMQVTRARTELSRCQE